MRSTEDVLRDHLDRRCRGDLEGDLDNNYADDLVVLCKDGVFRGKDGIRHTASILAENLPGAEFRYDLLRVADAFALLSWNATATDGSRTCHGADTFVVRDGRIVAQTIHFEVSGGPGGGDREPRPAAAVGSPKEASMEQIDSGGGEERPAGDDRLSRIRALLAEAANLDRPSEEVLDDIAAIIGPRAPTSTYQKPLG